MKNMTGKLEGFQKANLVALKADREQAFRDWCGAEKQRAAYADQLDKVAAHVAKLTELELRSMFAGFLVTRLCPVRPSCPRPTCW